MLTSDALDGLAGIRHGFFTRRGGASGGPYASRNCGYGAGDRPATVRRNRAAAMERLGLAAAALMTADQVHGSAVTVVEEPWPEGRAPVADGLVTRRPGLALGVLTADCAPVLLADPAAGVIGAAHAGWRGARAGILESTLALMVAAGARPADIVAAIGPCIARESYEVADDFKADFVADDAANAHYFVPGARPGHAMFDLAGYVAGRLSAFGVGRILRADGDTCAEADRFFSYRRSVLAGEAGYGRALSTIAVAA